MKLKEIFKIENILTNRKTPCDIEDFLNEEYYSESGNTFIKYEIGRASCRERV